MAEINGSIRRLLNLEMNNPTRENIVAIVAEELFRHGVIKITIVIITTDQRSAVQ